MTLPRPTQDPLTRRELEILRLLLIDQLCTKEIAGRLGITLRTAKHHREAINRKLGATHVLAVMRAAVDAGLVSVDELFPVSRHEPESISQRAG